MEEFLDAILNHGLEYYRKFYGVYRGTVTRVDDPEKRGRIQAIVPGALQIEAPDIWIDPAFEGAGFDRGSFFPPEKGDSVRVMFERGDPRLPVIYWGGWYGAPASRNGQSEVPSELGYDSSGQPTKRGIVTRTGHQLIFDDTDKAEEIRLVWHQPADTDLARNNTSLTADRSSGSTASFVMSANGNVAITNKSGSKITLNAADKKIVIEDENGNVITLDNSGMKVKAVQTIDLLAAFVNIAEGNDQPAVRGRDLLTWLTSHTHPTAWGPSGPPIVPPPLSMLSKNVRLK